MISPPMSPESSPSISGDRSSPGPTTAVLADSINGNPNEAPPETHDNPPASASTSVPMTSRSNRPARACTIRAASRMYSAPAVTERKQKPAAKKLQRQQDEESPQPLLCSKIVTQLLGPPEPSQLPRWTLRSMWELASVINFLHVFRPLLNISVEFSAEEFETALLNPNDTLSDIHMPLLKAIPPITRMALTRDTWVTVLCRKLRDWWHWVAEGELPIVASHGTETEVYKSLDPGVRVVILKAICDIRVEQDDIRNYIDNSLKQGGVHPSLFRKERVGGDSQGINYWYEEDPIMGHRLYREIRTVELKKGKMKGSQVLPSATYLWETVATNFDEFEDVSEKLFTSTNRTEVSLGKKLKIDMLPEVEKDQKRKERLLKKQHRQALLLDSFSNMDAIAAGRSLRDRKPVTYTFDDYDRSINEAIKITKKQSSPEPTQRREFSRTEVSTNGKFSGSSQNEHGGFSAPSPEPPDYDDVDEEHRSELLDRGDRRRQRPQRYSEREFVEAISDNDADFDSDDDIVGEAIYDEEYLRKRKQRKLSSSSEGDEEYRWEGENAEEEEEEEEEEESLSASEDSDMPRKFKKVSGRTRRETKLRSVDLQSGLRRSRRATRNRIDYTQYEFSGSEAESAKPDKLNVSNEHSDATESSMASQDSDVNEDQQEIKIDQTVEAANSETIEKEPTPTPTPTPTSPGKLNSPGQDDGEGGQKRRFLDLNELAPGSGFDDTVMKDDDTGDI